MDAASPWRRLIDFQRNTAFVAFVCIVAAYALLLMIDRLRTVLTPLFWASFFALPLNRAVTQFQKLWARFFSQRLCMRGRTKSERSIPLKQMMLPMEFRYEEGINEVRVTSTPANLVSLEKAQNPFAFWCCCNICCCCCRMPRLPCLSCCQRRIRIIRVDPPSGGGQMHQMHSKENRLRPEGHYYLGKLERDDAGHEIKMKLYLDHQSMRYPAIHEAGVGKGSEITGLLEVEQASTISWVFSIIVVFVGVVFVVGGFVNIVYLGVTVFQKQIPDYVKGTNELIQWLQENTRRLVPDETWEKIEEQVNQMLGAFLTNAAKGLLEGMIGFMEQLVFFFIYLLFWLCEPIPMDDTVTDMLKKYLFLKTFVCILFALLISLMLFALDCKMWFVFFPLTFMMNYLPEIGPILIAALIVPAVLLDGSMELGVRGRNTIIAIIGGIVAKFVTANIIEMRLYTQSGGEFMRMHPVILMAMMFVFYEVLGTTGLFLAVPIVALMKYCLVTADMPEMLLDPVLVAIEGDRMAPQRNFVDRMATKAARQTAYPPHQHSMEQGFSMQNLGTQDVDTKPLLDA